MPSPSLPPKTSCPHSAVCILVQLQGAIRPGAPVPGPGSHREGCQPPWHRVVHQGRYRGWRPCVIHRPLTLSSSSVLFFFFPHSLSPSASHFLLPLKPHPNTNQRHELVPGSRGVCMPSPSPRLISLHCHDLYQDIHVVGFRHCWTLFYACSCGVIDMYMSNVMVLLCGMCYILRVYVHIHNYIWLWIAFSIFAYDTLLLLVKGGERIPEH
jgi:hypothetical protein